MSLNEKDLLRPKEFQKMVRGIQKGLQQNLVGANGF
jgi:hypothetical protein